ncbi:7 transmembrane receptor (rhodopsin family) [Popillia japonica]|uniref:7 transmembrane receptor (Rhodopsin family) n=1 Tax=Popillia japonica TaxID=7064 RepID=A0AAW1K4R1_POPJA
MNVTPLYDSYYTYDYSYTVYNILNDTNDTRRNYSDANIFILPVWRQVLWSILYTGMIIVATGGNLIVIWIVLAHKRMRTVTNYFLLNLSVADTMVSTLNVTFSFMYMLHSHWPFGELYCKISQFISALSVCASVFSLMAISIDRYMAIMTPLRPRMGKSVTLCVAFTIWLVSIVFSSPYLMVWTIADLGDRVLCYPKWPDGLSNESIYDKIYNVLFLLFTYIVPIGSMTYTYVRIGIELWGSQSIGECTQRQMENIKNKRRVNSENFDFVTFNGNKTATLRNKKKGIPYVAV